MEQITANQHLQHFLTNYDVLVRYSCLSISANDPAVIIKHRRWWTTTATAHQLFKQLLTAVPWGWKCFHLFYFHCKQILNSKKYSVREKVCEWHDRVGCFEVCFLALIIHLLKPLWKEVELCAEETQLFEAWQPKRDTTVQRWAHWNTKITFKMVHLLHHLNVIHNNRQVHN